jgi:hypothetical protein
MQRRERTRRFQIRDHRIVDPTMRAAMRPTMDNPVSDHRRSRKALQRGLDRIEKAPVIVATIVGRFNRPTNQQDRIAIDRVQPIFQRRRPAIERQNYAHCQSRTSGRSSPCSAIYSLCRSIVVQ